MYMSCMYDLRLGRKDNNYFYFFPEKVLGTVLLNLGCEITQISSNELVVVGDIAITTPPNTGRIV